MKRSDASHLRQVTIIVTDELGDTEGTKRQQLTIASDSTVVPRIGSLWPCDTLFATVAMILMMLAVQLTCCKGSRASVDWRMGPSP